MAIEIRTEAFDPWVEVQRYQRQAFGQTGNYGATAVFVGTMRNLNDGGAVKAMTLEHYPGMTERHLERISAEARERWDIFDTLIIHRVGRLLPDDPIVLVAVWSAHRGASLDACGFLIEDLKSRAPFWKKEERDTGERWVEHNTAR
jgi:molybdopterin synthase catalytic subunit